MAQVTIIGFGKVGSHLYYALKKATGYKIRVIKKERYYQNNKNYSDEINKSDIIFITTQDSKIKSAAKQLNTHSINIKGKYVYHMSGVLTSDILNSLKKEGAETGSFHPVQTFEHPASERRFVSRFENIYVVLEGSKKAIPMGIEMARNLKSIPVTIDKKDKVLHHICCVISANYLIGLAYKLEEFKYKMKSIRLASERTGKILKNGFYKHGFFSIYEPLIMQTIENIKSKGAVKSLTGPIERNDIMTLDLHLRELRRKFPEFLPFYKFLGRETAKVAFKKRSIDKKDLNKLLRIFN